MNLAHPVPVNAVFGTDVLAQVVFLMSDDTADEAARKIAHHAIGRRVRALEATLALYHDGREVVSTATLGQAGIAPLAFVYVDYAEPAGAPR